METQKLIRILSSREVMNQTSLSRPTLWRACASEEPDRFPSPVRLTRNRIGWVEAEVQAWIAARPKRGVA